VNSEEAKLWTNLFRLAHPKLVETWKAFGVAAKEAILQPGSIQKVETNPIFSFVFKAQMLYMRLPNGRLLVFPFARYEKWLMPWGEKAMSVTHMWCNNAKGNKWERRGISGASLMQSADQGLSRDVLMEAALRVEEAGYPTIFRVHDEVNVLVPDDARYRIDRFKKLFEQVPEWCPDLPVTSDVWEGKRYRK
jgi:DNA polymerase